MLAAVLAYLRNWFVRTRLRGNFAVEGGVLELPDGVMAGTHVRVRGSMLNDGVWEWPAVGMRDEVFDGTVEVMAVPSELLSIVSEVEEWCAESLKASRGPYASESFGGYSYSLRSADGAQGGSGGPTWQSTFARDLARWRKL